MEEDLMARLLATPAITGLTGDRINWETRPQGVATLPALVLQKIADDTQVTLDGANGLIESTVQFDCWAPTKADVLALKRAVRAELIGARFVHGATAFEGIFLVNERGSFEEPGSEAPERYYRISMDLRIWHKN